jgi:inosine-uridine nucleoside N-ribohydrolase
LWCRSNINATTEFIREIHQHYMDFYEKNENIDGCYPHDFTCVCAAMRPEMFSWSRGRVRVLTKGDKRGLSEFESDSSARCLIAEDVDAAGLLELLRRTIAAA